MSWKNRLITFGLMLLAGCAGGLALSWAGVGSETAAPAATSAAVPVAATAPAAAPVATTARATASAAANGERGSWGTPVSAVKSDGKPWTFAVLADNRSAEERAKGSYEGVLNEIRDMTVNGTLRLPPVDVVVAAGDIKLSADEAANWKLWESTFKDAKRKPTLIPVIGNWDSGDEVFNKEVVLPTIPGVVGDDPEKYYVDWKNVRFIVSRDSEYVENSITSAPAHIEHVFIADHYPIFPRLAHVQPATDVGVAFWKMLLKHKDKVRALLVGHTHNYSRLRIADPAKARDVPWPDEEGGIYQIDAGNAGRESHGDPASTIVEVLVDGKKIHFRTIQAPHTDPNRFKIVDEWDFGEKSGDRQPAANPLNAIRNLLGGD